MLECDSLLFGHLLSRIIEEHNQLARFLSTSGWNVNVCKTTYLKSHIFPQLLVSQMKHAITTIRMINSQVFKPWTKFSNAGSIIRCWSKNFSARANLGRNIKSKPITNELSYRPTIVVEHYQCTLLHNPVFRFPVNTYTNIIIITLLVSPIV